MNNNIRENINNTRIPEYSFVGDEAVNVNYCIPVLQSEERMEVEETCSVPEDMKLDHGLPRQGHGKKDKKVDLTEEALLGKECRGCGEHKERLLRHLTSMAQCMKSYTAEEIERHKQTGETK